MPSSIFPPYPTRWDASHWNNANVTYKSDHLPPNQRFHRYATHPSQQCKNIRPPKKPIHAREQCIASTINQIKIPPNPRHQHLCDWSKCFLLLNSTFFPLLIFPNVFVSYVAHAVVEIETLRMPVYEFPGGRFIMLRWYFLVLLSSRFLKCNDLAVRCLSTGWMVALRQ